MPINNPVTSSTANATNTLQADVKTALKKELSPDDFITLFFSANEKSESDESNG